MDKQLYIEFASISDLILKAYSTERSNQDKSYDRYLSNPRCWIARVKVLISQYL
jgi:hypothetical protein